jgi:hypothetical protein
MKISGPRFPRLLKFAVFAAIALGSALSVGGQGRRGKLSSDLLSFESKRTTARTRAMELIWGDQVYNPEGMWADNRTIEGEELMWGDSAYGDQ